MSVALDPIRLQNITATEIATLFGLNKYSSPAKVLDQKLNPVEIVNNHVRRGKLKEPSVLEAFLLDLKMRTQRHEDGPVQMKGIRMSATPDAYVYGTSKVVECKSISSHTFDQWYSKIPSHYHMQVHAQMLVISSEEGYIGALEEGDPMYCEYRFAAWKVSRHRELELMMIEEATRFWESVKEGKLFRVNSAMKKKAIEILSETSSLLTPRPEGVSHEKAYSLSDVISIFESP